MQTYLSVFRSHKMASLLLLGFASGLPLFLVTRTLQQWLQDTQVDIGTITLFGLVGLPYSLKFLWSPLLDRFAPPIVGNRFLGKQRGWLLLTQIGLLLAISLLALQQPTQDTSVLQRFALIAVVIAFLSATQDIVGDAYRTDVLAPSELEAGASLWVLGYRVALFASFSLALYLASFTAWNVVYLLMAALMVIGLITTLWAPASTADRTPTAPLSQNDAILLLFIAGLVGSLFVGVSTGRIAISVLPWILAGLLVGWILLGIFSPKRNLAQSAPTLDSSGQSLAATSLQDVIVQPFQEFFQRSGVLQGGLILAFILLYRLGDSLVGITGNLFLREIGVGKAELATIQIWVVLPTATLGVIVGGLIMSQIGVYKALWVFGVLQLVSNLGYYALAIAGKNMALLAGAIGIENFCAGLVTVATTAYLMSLCSHQFTTTQFALFSSLMAISRDVLSAPAGDLVKLTGWGNFFLWTLVAALPGLLLLPIVAPWKQPLAQPNQDR
jgi:MFS transporter, PAT family, beta-lactamase induction signal transducer AmpG